MTQGRKRFSIRTLLVCAVMTFGSFGASGSAHAIFLTESNGHATLGGSIEPGDGQKFKAFLAQPRAVPLRVLWLESGGGSIAASIEIALLVKQARLTTAVRVSRGRCDSGCTFIFLAGFRRHYVGGETVVEGLSGLTGIGFHSASMRGDAVRFTVQSDAGNERMFHFYRSMGFPVAVEFARKAPFNSMYRISGATALRTGIATSLEEPK